MGRGEKSQEIVYFAAIYLPSTVIQSHISRIIEEEHGCPAHSEHVSQISPQFDFAQILHKIAQISHFHNVRLQPQGWESKKQEQQKDKVV
jgi:hypothetical protein